MTPEQARHALIPALLADGGTLALGRKLHRAMRELPGESPAQVLERLIKAQDVAAGEARLADLNAAGIRVTTLFDPDFPRLLTQIPDPPAALFYCGELSALHRPCVAVVGSRDCTLYGQQVAKQLAGELARLGFTVVSGLAHGIDAHAHRAVLAVKGRTAGVLGSGLNRIYPADHRPLARDMLNSGGVVVSEMEPGATPRGFHFPIRNRIISGLSHAVIVVEAGKRSGSLITAKHALDQGRDLLAVPGPINQSAAEGTNQLIYNGEARLCLSVESVLRELAPLLGLAAEFNQRCNTVISDPVAKIIYDRLDAFEAIPLDLLAAELELEAGLVMARLADLETLNLVEHKPGQRFLRNPLASA